MTSSPSLPGSHLAGQLGLTERIFVGPASRRLVSSVEAGLHLVDAALAERLKVTDALADSASRYLYEAGGKRVRPLLALLTAQLGDGNTPAVIDAATALEMTHLASLYHDDVMDSADKRRGVPSAHAVWGNNVAILTGDLLFSRASQIMADYGERAIRLQANTFERLVLGQMHETTGALPGEDPVEFYIEVLADKTGSLIGAAAQAGVIFSDADAAYEQPLHTFGEKVGVAFQLLDDVIDLSPDPAATGKVPGTDLRAGVSTMPLLLLRQATDAPSRDLLSRIDEGLARVADGAPAELLDPHIDALRSHPATERTLELAASWSKAANDAIAPLPRGAIKDALHRFADAMVDRAQ